ncbi:MAG: flagellar hook-associated protein FlgL [Nitrospinae bacterium]|nr:flagellar hook-associated protein FlgL [Nitrospinota bacterium]
MIRLTNAMLYNNALTNLSSENQNLLQINNQVSSGKRVNSPADDPVAIGQILNYQTNLNDNAQFTSNTNHANNLLSQADTVLTSTSSLATEAQTLITQMSSGTYTAQNRLTNAAQADSFIAQAEQLGNTRIGSQYIFGGTNNGTPPINTNGQYVGGSTPLTAQVETSTMVQTAPLASSFLAGSMNPNLNISAGSSTPLSAIKGGVGVGTTPATFTVTDRAGNVTTVNVASGSNLNAVITAINGGAAKVTASLAKNGQSIQITDNNTTGITGPLTITDTTGTAAASLGIAGSRNISSFAGDNIAPALTTGTSISDLFGGAGMSLTNISVQNGGVTNTVSFAGAKTIGDIITAINGATPSANVTAGINSAGNALTVTSNNPATVAIASDIGNGSTASKLGLDGGTNMIKTLQDLSSALKLNDTDALRALIPAFQSVVNNISLVQGVVGASVNQLTTNNTFLSSNVSSVTAALSSVQDADMASVLTQLAQLQTAYQATAKVTAQILQPGLLSYL